MNIGATNGPRSNTVAGPKEEVRWFMDSLIFENPAMEKLMNEIPVSIVAHCDLIQSALEPYKSLLDEYDFQDL